MVIEKLSMMQRYTFWVLITKLLLNVKSITWHDDDIFDLENIKTQKFNRYHWYEFATTMLSHALYRKIQTSLEGALDETYDEWKYRMHTTNKHVIDYLSDVYHQYL